MSKTKRPIDSKFIVGQKVIGELLFLCSNSGQISLFYSNKKFNPTLAKLSFTRTFLEELINKFFKRDPVLFDWGLLVDQTFKQSESKKERDANKLPVLCAYLLNYSGSKAPVSLLLRDYFNTFQENPDYLHPVIKLMQQFPRRDISAVLFDALETSVIKNPHLLDTTVLHHMARYYCEQILKKEAKSPQAELNLLLYFGQNKYYPLVQKGCEELADLCDDKSLKKRLMKGASEAKVEGSLSASLGRFYFGLVKFFKRLWHYGFNAEKNASKLVKFCDDNSPGIVRKRAQEHVCKPLPVVQVTHAELTFEERRKQLISLLTTIKRSPTITSGLTRPSCTVQSLFHNVPDPKWVAQENGDDSKKEVVNM